MKSLQKGNYALAIAHPGHELRLHGFLEQTSAFVFILTDGSNRAGQDLMMDSIKAIDKACKHGKKLSLAYMQSNESKKIFKLSNHEADPGNEHLKDTQIYNEILNQHTDLFAMYINFMATNLIKYKIDYLVSDSSEGTNVCHEINSIMADIAVKLVEKKLGRKIIRYDFAIDKPYNEHLQDDYIHIELDSDAINRKLDAMLKFPLALTDMRPNVSIPVSLIVEMGKMENGREATKEMVKDINSGFLSNEYLRPSFTCDYNEKPAYEIQGEKAVASGKYAQVITYESHLKPLKQKLTQLILTNGTN